ncbi:uncharacterized protein JCM6883_002160 [Sporobolomyces salmoneus]|uniref:uncharacterized protein n=1 Tax=Sporobolomyces salmoneus TaxID=183962 RepID=UPI00317ADCFA
MVTTRSGARKRVVVADPGSSSSEEEEVKPKRTSLKKKGKATRTRRDPSADSDDVYEEELLPKKKKSKLAVGQPHSQSRTSQSRLQFTELPIDVLADICLHLPPLDLLHLSRTSRSFFNLLDSAAFHHVWIASRQKVELPELTAKDLGGLKYAALVYGDHCQLCGKKGKTSAEWFTRKRYCWPCRKANLIPQFEHVKKKFKPHVFLYECVPSSLRGGGGANLGKTVYFDYPSLHSPNSELQAIQSRIDALRPKSYRSPIHSTNYLAVGRRYRRLVEEGEEDEEFEEDERELRDYVMEKREWRECVRRDAEKLEEWERNHRTGGY